MSPQTPTDDDRVAAPHGQIERVGLGVGSTALITPLGSNRNRSHNLDDGHVMAWDHVGVGLGQSFSPVRHGNRDECVA